MPKRPTENRNHKKEYFVKFTHNQQYQIGRLRRQNKNLSLSACYTWLVFRRFCDVDNECWPGKKALSSLLGTNAWTQIRAYREELIDAKLLKMYFHRQTPQITVYKIYMPDQERDYEEDGWENSVHERIRTDSKFLRGKIEKKENTIATNTIVNNHSVNDTSVSHIQEEDSYSKNYSKWDHGPGRTTVHQITAPERVFFLCHRRKQNGKL